MKFTNNSGTTTRNSENSNTANTSVSFVKSPVNDALENTTTKSTNSNNGSKEKSITSAKNVESLVDYGYTGDNKVDSTQTEKKNNLFKSFDDLKTDDEIIRTLWSNGIYRKNDYDDFNSFYIFPRRDPYKMLGTTREYIFITKPDLHIFGTSNNQLKVLGPSSVRSTTYANITSSKTNTSSLNSELDGSLFFTDLFKRGYKDVLTSLCYSADRTNPFVNILSNYKTSNIELSNISVGDEETAANIYNTRIFYRKPSDSADEDSEITIEFKDNKYLDCYLWFKAYDIYERLKYQGKVSPMDWNYVLYKVLSDQMTIFRFIVADDGETIIHWSQMWGCYPKSVPRAVLSDMPEDGQLRFTTEWRVTFQSDMDPLTISHFKALCEMYMQGKNLKQVKLYDEISQRITGESASIPYVTRGTNTNPRQMYRLLWYKKT